MALCPAGKRPGAWFFEVQSGPFVLENRAERGLP